MPIVARRIVASAADRIAALRVLHLVRAAANAALPCLLLARASAVPSPGSSPFATPMSTRTIHLGILPVVTGEPIDLAELSGRIVFDDFEDVFAMDVDGSDVVTVAADPAGPEFDGAWSPDGQWIVYRDSTRGINEDDEIFIAAPTVRSAADHQRPGERLGPGLVARWNDDRLQLRPRGGARVATSWHPDGTNLRPLAIDGWVEYPSFSPDGTRIAFMGHEGSNYEIFVADLATGAVNQLTDAPARTAGRLVAGRLDDRLHLRS